ncbi:MAG: DUF4124 domain-containing protein [Desulfobacterales bacterium]
MKILIPLILFSMFCLGTSLEADEIYQWVDQNGVKHFTNQPPPPGAKIVNQQQAIQTDEAAVQANKQQQQKVLKEAAEQQESQSAPQAESQQESQAGQQVQTGSSYSNSDDNEGDVYVNPDVRNREELRRIYKRRHRLDDEIVTPLPEREREPGRMR